MTETALAEDIITSTDSSTDFEVILEKRSLLNSLSLLTPVVEKRNVVPILSNIKLEAKGSKLVITATDMDLSIAEELGAQVRKPGSLTVNCKTFAEIVRKLPDEEVHIRFKAEAEQIEIVGSSCLFSLATLPASEFPTLEQADVSVKFALPAYELAKLIEYTKFSISNEETRYNLNGIYLHISELGGTHSYAAAATDGHRLSYASTKAPEEALTAQGIILPKKATNELVKIIKDPMRSDENVTIELDNNKVKFSCGNIVFISKLIDGNFPEYKAFFPQNNKNRLTIDTKLLESSVDRIATITVEKFRAIKIALTANNITISAFGESRGSAQEILAVNKNAGEGSTTVLYEGEPLIIGFNPKYLTDALSVIDSKNVEIYFDDSFAPTLIKPSDDPSSAFVVMPIKV